MFNVDLNKIQLVNGLWKIVDNQITVTTSIFCGEYIGAVSFRNIAVIPEPIHIGKISDNFNKSSNSIKPTLNNYVKIPRKVYPKRKIQMECKFGPDVDNRSHLEISESRRLFAEQILKDLNNCVEITQDVKSAREKRRDDYSKSITRRTAIINNVKNKYTNISHNNNNTNEKKLRPPRGNFDISPDIDMTKYEHVDDDKVHEFKNNFEFSTVISYNKYYMQTHSLNVISKYYEKCKEKGKMLKELLYDLHNKVSLDDIKNKTNNLGSLFKYGKINSDSYKHYMYISSI